MIKPTITKCDCWFIYKFMNNITGDSIGKLVYNSISRFVGNSVWDSVRDSVCDEIYNEIYKYEFRK